MTHIHLKYLVIPIRGDFVSDGMLNLGDKINRKEDNMGRTNGRNAASFFGKRYNTSPSWSNMIVAPMCLGDSLNAMSILRTTHIIVFLGFCIQHTSYVRKEAPVGQHSLRARKSPRGPRAPCLCGACMFSLCLHGFLWELWLPPSVQRHAFGSVCLCLSEQLFPGLPSVSPEGSRGRPCPPPATPL